MGQIQELSVVFVYQIKLKSWITPHRSGIGVDVKTKILELNKMGTVEPDLE